MSHLRTGTATRAMIVGAGLAACALLLTGCHLDMWNQPRYEPLEASLFFEDGLSARTPVPGTVAYKQPRLDDHFYTGFVDGDWAKTFPFEVDEEVLRRGRERFNIFCSPCHGRTGEGNGMIIQRGMAASAEVGGIKVPPSYHEQRLVNQPPGYFYDVITNGFGTMFSYASRVPPRDRWAIVAYIRALQASRRAPVDSLDPELQQQLAHAEPNQNVFPGQPDETSDESH